jgi:dihydrofolate reductase
MPKIKLYIATSLDGYIAREDGSLDWLNNISNPDNTDHGYNEFYSEIDTLILGRKTYEEILGFDVEWPYGNSLSYVVTKDKSFKIKTEKTEIVTSIDRKFIQYLKNHSKKDIWLVGGGKLISRFLELDAINEMILSIIPIILGKGIPLFPYGSSETRFRFVKSDTYNTGIVNLFYEK